MRFMNATVHPTYTIGKEGILDPCRGGQIQKIWKDGT